MIFYRFADFIDWKVISPKTVFNFFPDPKVISLDDVTGSIIKYAKNTITGAIAYYPVGFVFNYYFK